MDEMHSHLDYAKLIHNKPKLNAHMTRNALLKEYVAEIKRLKADVLAMWEKNGNFFWQEVWGVMSAEQELRQMEWEEEMAEGSNRLSNHQAAQNTVSTLEFMVTVPENPVRSLATELQLQLLSLVKPYASGSFTTSLPTTNTNISLIRTPVAKLTADNHCLRRVG